MNPQRTVRAPAVAGLFYTSNARALRREVEEMLDHAAQSLPDIAGPAIGVISPHAGLIYSGQTAAHAYAILNRTDFDTVVLVGPSHREHLAGASVYSGDAFSSPLGEMAVEVGLARMIAESGGGISLSESGHRGEHALEVQLPFLQCIRPKATIVPVTMGDQSTPACVELSTVLATALRGCNVVLVASSDLSHYHSSAEARALDARVIECVRAYDPEDLGRLLDAEVVEACGGGPIVTVMMAARTLGSTNAVILHSCNSGDITGDASSVVGYLSAAFTVN